MGEEEGGNPGTSEAGRTTLKKTGQVAAAGVSPQPEKGLCHPAEHTDRRRPERSEKGPGTLEGVAFLATAVASVYGRELLKECHLHTSLSPSLSLGGCLSAWCFAACSFLEHSRAFLSSLFLRTDGGREPQSPRGIAGRCLRTPRALGCSASCLCEAGSEPAVCFMFSSLLLAGPHQDQVQGGGRELPQACCALRRGGGLQAEERRAGLW